MNRSLGIIVCALALLAARHATAGMPSVLPEDFVQVFRLNESIGHRLQSISFFGFVFVLATIVFWGLWNNLARGFSAMPRLNLVRAACFTLLIGSLFVVVLTMISGARELLTPGAWRKEGLTYTVAPPETSSESDNVVRPPDGVARVLP